MDNELKKLARSIVVELVDCGAADFEPVQQYLAWTEKKLRPLLAELENARKESTYFCNLNAQKNERIAELEHEKGNRGEGWRPDADPITGSKFFMWIAHPEKGMVPTYGGPYDSYTLAERDKDGSYWVEQYDHDMGSWRGYDRGVEDCGVQVVDDQLYVSEEDPDDLKSEIAALRAKLATPVRLPEPSVYEVNGTRFYDRLSEAEVISVLREQGYTVEGDA